MLLDAEKLARDLFFSHLFGGEFFRSESEILSATADLGLDMPYCKFILASVRIEEWGKPFRSEIEDLSRDDINDLFFILRNVFQELLTFDGCVCHGAIYRGRLICLLNSDFIMENWREILRSNAEKAIAFLDEQFDIDVEVAFSRIADNLFHLPMAQLDVEDIHQYIQVIGEDLQVVFYEDLTEVNIRQSETNFIELEGALRSSLRRFDTDGARFATSELISREFHSAPPTIQIFRFRVYGLVNTLLFVLEELRAIMGPEEYSKLNVGPRLTRAGTLSEILAEVEGIFDQLDEYSKQHEGDARPGWVTRVRKYIEDNFADVNVTVSSTAGHFNMTPSYCTRAFKRYVGVSLFDYIQQKRIEAAKKLLARNLSLSEVAQQVGFSSPLTMNRAFKRYEGVSPGKFRSF